LTGQDVQGRSNQLDLDLVLGGVVGLGGTEGILDGIDSVVTEAGNLDIGTDLGGVGSELAADVLLELLLDGLAGERDIVPDGGVSRFVCQRDPWALDSKNIRDGDLEGVVRVAEFPVQGPTDSLV
jgi:hypothetical protein